MKRLFIGLLFVLFFSFYSCTEKNSAGEVIGKPDQITSDVMSWIRYKQKHIKLHKQFVAFDTLTKPMDRGEFIRLLTTGKYVPLKLTSEDSLTHYKLFALPPRVDKMTRAVIKDLGKTEYAHFRMEGKPLPGLSFVDIEDKKYDNQTTMNKIVVVKFWFIGCTACVEEMPELNRMVERYKKRDDIVFVSITPDSKDRLEKFLEKREFDYGVVADKESYIKDSLKIRIFPTHIIIDKQGMVTSVVTSARDLIPMVDDLAGGI